MRHIGKNVYLLTENNYINIENDDIIVSNCNNGKIRIPATLIENIVILVTIQYHLMF